jgi:hypothetical protein
LRHHDHRFEWTRAECQAWADQVATRYGYHMSHRYLGPLDPDLGAPSQLVIFDRAAMGDNPLDESANEPNEHIERTSNDE